MEYRELVQEAKKMGIKSHGKKKDELESLVLGSAESALAPTDEQKQAAKEARTERRSRRGGALLGKGEAKLNRPEFQRKGYHRRWFRDEGGRVSSAYGNDWDKVESVKPIVSGTNRDGSIRRMVLMEKRLDWYNEDQLKKREADIRKEKFLKEGKVDDAQYTRASQDLAMYTPTEGVNINSSIIKK